jgi:hypothetical protein
MPPKKKAESKDKEYPKKIIPPPAKYRIKKFLKDRKKRD